MATCVKIRRKSNVSDPMELVNQDMIIDPFIAKMGWNQLDEITLNGVPRWDMLDEANHLVFKLKSLKPDYVIYRDHDRIGFKNPAEIGFFITSLKQLDIKIMTANDEQIVDMTDLASTMRTVQNQLASSAEIEKKGYRTQIARRKTIEKKSSPGKMCAYGYDWVVYNRDGIFKYRVIYDGYKKCEGRHWTDPPKNTRSRANFALMRWKELPNGERVPYHDEWVQDSQKSWVLLKSKPIMEIGDRKTEIINSDRAKIVQQIYQLADTPEYKTPWEIACALDEQNIKPFMGEKWDGKTVKCILTNPIYKGHPVDNVTSKAKTTRLNEEIVQCPLTDEERESIRIVSVEQWDRVNQYLQQNQTGYKRKRRANLGDFWAKCFLMCGNCNDILYVQNSTEWKPSKNYRCNKCGAVKTDVIHELVDNWLIWLEQSYITFAEKVKSSNGIVNELIEEILNPENEKSNSVITECAKIAQKMYKFILASLPGTTEEEKSQAFKKRVWKYMALPSDSDTDYLEQTYQEIFDETHSSVQDRVSRLKFEKQKLILKFADMGDDLDVKQLIRNKQIEIEQLEGGLNSLIAQYRKAKQNLIELAATIQTLCKDVVKAEGEEKAVLLRSHLKDMILYFDDVKNNICKLNKVEIHAVNPFIPTQTIEINECQLLIEKYNGRRTARLGKKWSEESRKKLSDVRKQQNMERNGKGQFLPKASEC